MTGHFPEDESRRIAALEAARILDTPEEKSFDDLARLAAFICGTPISLISLVDDRRQWFKAKVGLDVSETPRDLAFCAHAILKPDEVMVVNDATKDQRFSNNPLVTNDPNIRFYAGAPLVTQEGFALGTLCVIDRVPRTLSPHQLEALTIVRNQVVREMAMRRHTAVLSSSLATSERASDSLKQLADSLETAVRERTGELEQRNQEILQQTELLQSLTRRLMNAQDMEQRRIARELHDSAGQVVTALSMNLGQLLAALNESNPDLVPLAEQGRAYADEINREIRTTSYLLHPPLLDEVGLRAALKWYLEGLKQRAGLDVELIVNSEFERPSRDVELTIFRVIQECLTNIHRHSECKSATISIFREGAEVVVVVRDSGRGIAPEKLAKIRAMGAGVGLRGMRERVHQFGGRLAIDSQPGAGTTITAHLPMSSAGPDGVPA